MSHQHGGEADTRGDRRRLAVVLGITVSVLVVEAVGGVVTGSLALIADAGHMLTDAAGLAMALFAAYLSIKPATHQRTWGYKRAEVLAAVAQATLLLAVGLFIVVEGVRRLIEPVDVASTGMLVFGAIGLAGNVVAIMVLVRRRRANLNLRAAFLEVLSDALGSVGVVVAAVVIATTGWLRADAVVSLLIGALIVPRTLMLLRDAGTVLLESTPKGLELEVVRRHILELEHVVDVHDLHASQIATGLPILSAHVVVDDQCFHNGELPRLLDQLQSCVLEHFEVSVEHSTFQFEPPTHLDHEGAAHP